MTGFKWVKPPEAELMPNIEAYGQRVMVAVRAVADYMAQKVQGEMRAGAPWKDRTRLARLSLYSVVEQAAEDAVTIWLSHGSAIEYGVYLELAHGKKYAVIMPTIQANLPVIEGMLKQIFEG